MALAAHNPPDCGCCQSSNFRIGGDPGASCGFDRLHSGETLICLSRQETGLAPTKSSTPYVRAGWAKYGRRDTRLGRIVAIKLLKEQHSERFEQEARAVAALNHPNICQI